MHNIDPRSKINRINKQGKPLEQEPVKWPGSDVQPKALTVPNVVIVVTMGESSSWSGQKPDGYAYVPNKAALDLFLAHLQRSKSREEFSYVAGINLKVVASACLEIMSTKISENPERPWLWVDTDYSVKLWS